MLKTVFFGTPSVAVPFLEELHKKTQIALVVTQPDRPAGRRGLELLACPVKKRALELGLNVISPEIFKDSVPQIAAIGADFGLAVAYGKIFKKPALEAFKAGIVNIHFSLLPQYRGAAPVQQALFDGQKQTGISAFWIDEGLDTGPVALQKTVDIKDSDDAATLFPKLIEAGKDALQILIQDLEAGRVQKTQQQGEPTFAPQISKEQTFVSFADMSAEQIHNLTRGLALGMPAYAKALSPQGEAVQLLKTELRQIPPPAPKDAKPGQLIYIESKGGCFVQCKQGVLYINNIRPAGKNIMPLSAYTNGRKLAAGMVIFK